MRLIVFTIVSFIATVEFQLDLRHSFFLRCTT